MLPGIELENDPEDNPCFGCGPNNPVGLRMRFFDDGKVVRCELTLDERYGGSHEHVLDPIVYAAMDETITWAGYARFGELPATVTDAPTRLRYHATVRVDVPFVTECSVESGGGDTMTLLAVVTQEGKRVAEMAWPMRRRTQAEIEKSLASRPRMPRSNRAELERMLLQRKEGR